MIKEVMELKVKVGDVLIRKDGLKGRVGLIKDGDTRTICARYEDGTVEPLNLSCLSDYYLIGRTIVGHKCTVEELEQRIAEKDEEIQRIRQEKSQLRKQLWRLQEEMVEDWRERRALRILRKPQQEQQVQQTQDE